jgi:Rab3 GTPase-activating protein non-catalytic subunit
VRLGIKVAENVTKAVFGMAKGLLFGNSKKSDVKPQPLSPRQTTPTRLSQKCFLSDPTRTVKSVALSPSRSLAVLTDNFGRIFLLDVEMFVLIRQWKGYRDAQCGWVTDSKKRGNYLVIYAPFRGLLEIWKCPHGTRVGARNLGEVSAHGLHFSINMDSSGKRVARAYLIRLADGYAREIDVS